MTFKLGPSTNNIYTTELHVCTQQHMPTANKKVNEKSCRLRMGAYKDGVKRKGDKIGMGV